MNGVCQHSITSRNIPKDTLIKQINPLVIDKHEFECQKKSKFGDLINIFGSGGLRHQEKEPIFLFSFLNFH